MYEDILESRRLAFVRDGWAYGELMNRIGNPFTWVDGEQIESIGSFASRVGLFQYLAMSGEIYPTPKDIYVNDHDEMEARIAKKLDKTIKKLVPFLTSLDIDYYIAGTANVKVQDYAAIRTWAKDLPREPRHLDVGPGLGANAIYSTLGFNSYYISIEANPTSYDVQRQFLRTLTSDDEKFLDLVDCNSFGLSEGSIKKELNSTNHYRFKLLPSWNFSFLDDSSIDLASATWVLNEINQAGISWLLHQISRCLKIGGYFYIRDSHLRKPMRHSLDYDVALGEIGFEQVAILEVKNRINMHGIPRIYRKTQNIDLSFLEIFDKFFGKFAIGSHGGGFDN